MSTPDFFIHIYAWLMSDWTHPIVAAAAFTAVTPTPKAGTWLAHVYKVVDALALNVLHAKATGVSPQALAEQIAVSLIQKQATQTAPVLSNPEVKPAVLSDKVQL